MTLGQGLLFGIAANVVVTYSIVALLSGSLPLLLLMGTVWTSVLVGFLIWFKRRSDERRRFESEWSRDGGA